MASDPLDRIKQWVPDWESYENLSSKYEIMLENRREMMEIFNDLARTPSTDDAHRDELIHEMTNLVQKIQAVTAGIDSMKRQGLDEI
jgi:hypothetical protein